MKKIVALSFAALLVIGAMPALAGGAADGAAVFKAKCAMCHGADGKKVNKATNVRDLTSADVQKQTDQELYDIIANGKAKMPPYKAKLNDADTKALVVTIRDLAKK